MLVINVNDDFYDKGLNLYMDYECEFVKFVKGEYELEYSKEEIEKVFEFMRLKNEGDYDLFLFFEDVESVLSEKEFC